MPATTSKESLESSKYFVIGIKGNTVYLGNYHTGYKTIIYDEAVKLGQDGYILGYINNKLVPCIHAEKQFNDKYYFCDSNLYRYDSGSYFLVNPRIFTKDCAFYNVGNTYVFVKDGNYSCKHSIMLNKKYNFLDANSVHLNDGRLFIHVQGIKNYCYNTVQAIFNEIYYVNGYKLEDIYITDDSNFEKLSAQYKDVSANSKSISDIKQRILNNQIKTELERFNLNKIGNVLILGNLEIDLGGDNEV